MAEFKDGDIVYHKASLKKGVIAYKTAGGEWWVKWDEKEGTACTDAELLTEEEYKEKHPKKSGNIKVRFR